MLNFNAFEEALNSIKQHKRRNILTGFGVAWGIFILVTILSAGDPACVSDLSDNDLYSLSMCEVHSFVCENRLFRY